MTEFAKKLRACFIALLTCALIEVAIGAIAYRIGLLGLYIGCFIILVILEFAIFILTDIRANKKMKELE